MSVIPIKVKDVVIAEHNRTVDNDRALKELAASIKANGLVEPIVVRPKDGRYELIAGARRLLALDLLGETELKLADVKVVEASDAEAEDLRLAENLHREELHPVDEIRGYAALLKLGYGAEDIAKKSGKPLRYVLRRLVLMELPEKGKAAYRKGTLSA